MVPRQLGLRHGLDMRSAREPLASLFYDVKHTVEFWQPAVTRQRKLAAAALGYTYEGPPDFGLERITDGVEIQPYAVIMPSASRDDKLWPEEDWHKVFGRLREKSRGKDTTIGHWELAGIVSEQPMPTYPQGFPPELIAELEQGFGRRILCNKPYSGTQVIKDAARAAGDYRLLHPHAAVVHLADQIDLRAADLGVHALLAIAQNFGRIGQQLADRHGVAGMHRQGDHAFNLR